MNILIEQTEVELRAEISFWTDFVAEWQDSRDEPVHSRAYEALDRAESRLEYLLTMMSPYSTKVIWRMMQT